MDGRYGECFGASIFERDVNNARRRGGSSGIFSWGFF